MFRTAFSCPAMVAVALVCLVAPPDSVGAQERLAAISGNVTADGVDLTGVHVIWTRGGDADSIPLAAFGGSYEFTGLRPGNHSIFLSGLPEGYWSDPARYDARLGPGDVATDWNFLVQSPTPVEIVLDFSRDSVRGQLRVEPDPLFIHPGEQIEWGSPQVIAANGRRARVNGPISIHFDPISPLTVRRAQAGAGGTILGQVRHIVQPGSYRYFVAFLYESMIYTEDPELIDENGENPPPGPGGNR